MSAFAIMRERGNFSETSASFVWKLDNFTDYIRKRYPIKSTIFKFSSISWNMQLDKAMHDICGDKVTVILVNNSVAAKANTVEVCWTASVIDKTGCKKETRGNVAKEHYTKVLSISTGLLIGKDHEMLLPNNCLQILLELSISKYLPYQKPKKDQTRNQLLAQSSCLCSLSNNLAKLLEKGVLADVVFKVGEKNFPAHKSILFARSKVFAAMLQHDMEEKSSGSVTIDDIDPANFKLLLRYIYSGDLPELSTENIYELYAAADKYAIMGLKKRCMQQMLDGLSGDNALAYLKIADLHTDVELKEGAIDYFLIHDHLFLGENWKKFSKEHSDLAVSVLNRYTERKLTEPNFRSQPSSSHQAAGSHDSYAANSQHCD